MSDTKPDVVIFPKINASQNERCQSCARDFRHGNDYPVTILRFGGFWKGVCIPLCDGCLDRLRSILFPDPLSSVSTSPQATAGAVGDES